MVWESGTDVLPAPHDKGNRRQGESRQYRSKLTARERLAMLLALETTYQMTHQEDSSQAEALQQTEDSNQTREETQYPPCPVCNQSVTEDSQWMCPLCWETEVRSSSTPTHESGDETYISIQDSSCEDSFSSEEPERGVCSGETTERWTLMTMITAGELIRGPVIHLFHRQRRTGKE